MNESRDKQRIRELESALEGIATLINRSGSATGTTGLMHGILQIIKAELDPLSGNDDNELSQQNTTQSGADC